MNRMPHLCCLYKLVYTLQLESDGLLCVTITFARACKMGQTSFNGPQWEVADPEIKVLSGENTELKGSPFKARSRSVYCYAC